MRLVPSVDVSMSAPTVVDVTEPTPESTRAPLLSEDERRADFVGLAIIRTETGVIEHRSYFTGDEVDMPGYVESVERGYAGTAWHTERMWRTDADPAETARAEDAPAEQADDNTQN